MVRTNAKRQSVRRGLIFGSFLLFPVIIYYLSPYLIIDSASRGIVNGSFLVFALIFAASLFFGRAWCGWLCPLAGMQEACTPIQGKNATGGEWNWIKWGIWIPWIGLIAAMALSAGGYHLVDPFYGIARTLSVTDENGMMTYSSKFISIAEPMAYITYYTVVGSVMVLSLSAGKRAFCHYACWIAPFMILGRKIRNLAHTPALRLIAEPSKCSDCMTCVRNCPMSLDVNGMVKINQMENSECILCGNCVDHCAKGVIRYSL